MCTKLVNPVIIQESCYSGLRQTAYDRNILKKKQKKKTRLAFEQLDSKAVNFQISSVAIQEE